MEFWAQFWPALLADFVSGLVVLYLAYVLVKAFRKPRLCVEALVKRETEHHVEVAILLRNIGRRSLDRYAAYWHILIDSRLMIVDATLEPEIDRQLVRENETVHFKGQVIGPVFPGRPSELIRIIFSRPSFDGGGLYYFLSTAHGEYPSYLSLIKNGETRQKYLPSFATIGINGVKAERIRGPKMSEQFKLWMEPRS